MSIKALKDAKFSPGLQQSSGRRRLQPATSFSPRHAARILSAYDENHDSAAATDSDEDDAAEERRRRRQANSRAHAAASSQLAQQQQQAKPPFDPKTSTIAPKVPRASEAALYRPSGGDRVLTISHPKVDLTHVQSRIPRARASPPSASAAAAASASTSGPRSSDVRIWDQAQKGRYEHIGAKVPTAAAASAYKPSGGHVTIVHRKLDWREAAKTTLPVTAAEASTYRPHGGEKTNIVQHAPLDLSSVRHSSAIVPSAEAKKYVPSGGDVNVFQWKHSGAVDARRQPPPVKTEMELLEELFPGATKTLTETPTALTTYRTARLLQSDEGDEKHQAQPSDLPSANRRRRRDLLLAS